MKRREFIALVGGAVASPLVVTAAGIAGLANSSTLILTCQASDSFGTGTGTVTINSSAAATTGLPAAVSANGRYFVDSVGNPVWIIMDSCQAGCLQTPADIQYYVNSRKAAGYNAIQYGAVVPSKVCHGVMTTDPENAFIANANGQVPFTGGPSANPFTGSTFTASQANEAYWTVIDQHVAAIGNAGLFCSINAMEAGGTFMEGIYDNATQGAMTAWGAWLAARYPQPYVGWYFGNDYQTTATRDANLKALIIGLKSVSPNAMYWGEMTYGHSTANQWNPSTWWPPVMNGQGTYDYGPSYQGCTVAYLNSTQTFGGVTGKNSNPPRPVVFCEGVYEFESYYGDGAYPFEYAHRFQTWGLALSGCSCFHHGNTMVSTGFRTTIAPPIGGYDATQPYWKNNMDTLTSVQLASIFKTFINSIAWWTLAPDWTFAFVTSNNATKISNVSGWSTGNTYVPAAIDSVATGAATLGVAYLNVSSATVNMALFSGKVTLQWFDPTNGTYRSAGSLANSGSQVFTIPGNNSAGKPDWVLLLTSGGGTPP